MVRERWRTLSQQVFREGSALLRAALSPARILRSQPRTVRLALLRSAAGRAGVVSRFHPARAKVTSPSGLESGSRKAPGGFVLPHQLRAGGHDGLNSQDAIRSVEGPGATTAGGIMAEAQAAAAGVLRGSFLANRRDSEVSISQSSIDHLPGKTVPPRGSLVQRCSADNPSTPTNPSNQARRQARVACMNSSSPPSPRRILSIVAWSHLLLAGEYQERVKQRSSRTRAAPRRGDQERGGAWLLPWQQEVVR